MNNRLIAVVMVAALASGCAQFKRDIDPRAGVEGYDPQRVTRPTPTAPNLFIDRNEFIVVDQEPIRVFRSKPRNEAERTEIVWALPAQTNFTFPPDGIRFVEPPPGLKCNGGGKLFRCSFDLSTDRERTYKYIVTVQQGQRRLQVLDPTIVSMP